VKIKSAEFVTSVRKPAECPVWDRPEFALIGRSNVGKSSLINMLANREALAKVSATPGKTRLLNFFLMNQTWCLVDLPGYGFAKIAKNERFDFNELVGDYLEGRDNLRRVFILIDSRIPPQRIDLEFTNWLAATGVPYSLVFNKTDKQSPTKIRSSIGSFLAALTETGPAVGPQEVLTSSARTRDGRGGILKAISDCLDG
jgi:GTP-binding protein